MSESLPPPSLLRQGTHFVLIGVLQLLLDWAVFVLLSGWAVAPAAANIVGRVAGAMLGFWLNGRVTFANRGAPRLGWNRFGRFLALWLILTAISTVLVSWVATQLGLQQAWLAKPLVEGMLAIAAFFLWRHLVYK